MSERIRFSELFDDEAPGAEESSRPEPSGYDRAAASPDGPSGQRAGRSDEGSAQTGATSVAPVPLDEPRGSDSPASDAPDLQLLARLRLALEAHALRMLLVTIGATAVCLPLAYHYRLEHRRFEAVAVVGKRKASQQVKVSQALHRPGKLDARTVVTLLGLPQNLARIARRAGVSARAVKSQLEIDHRRNSEVIRLVARSARPKLAKKLANAAGVVLAQRQVAVGRAEARAYYAIYAQQLAGAKRELGRAQKALQDFRQRHGIVELDAEIEIMLKKLADVDLRAYEAVVRSQIAGIRAKTLARAVRRATSRKLQSVTFKSPTGEKVAELRGKLAGYRGRYTKRNPKLRKLRRQLATLRRAKRDDGVQVSYTLGRDPGRAQMDGERVNQEAIRRAQLDANALYQARYKKARATLARLSTHKRRYSELVRRQGFATALVARLYALAEHARAAIEANAPTYAVLEPAALPTTPMPSKVKYAALALPLLVLLGYAGLVIVRELADPRAKSSRLAATTTGLPVLMELVHAAGDQQLEQSYAHLALSVQSQLRDGRRLAVCGVSDGRHVDAVARELGARLGAPSDDDANREAPTAASDTRTVSGAGRAVTGAALTVVALPALLGRAETRSALRGYDVALLVVDASGDTREDLAAAHALLAAEVRCVGLALLTVARELVLRREFVRHVPPRGWWSRLRPPRNREARA